MYRYKCFGPNKTYFMNFCQKLSILKLIYEKKQICYFHVGYAKNCIEKTSSIFNWPQNRQKSLNFQKNDIFRILRFFSFELLQEKFGFWQFLEVSVTIFEKLQKISTFFNDFIILTSQTSFDLTNFDKFYLA